MGFMKREGRFILGGQAIRINGFNEEYVRFNWGWLVEVKKGINRNGTNRVT